MELERILLDIETQQDFFRPDGALYNERSHPTLERITRLFEWVRRNDIPVMSTVLRVRPLDRGPFGEVPHCVDGTEGERKVPRTILPRRINMGLLNTTDLPANIFSRYQQVIFEKRDTDIFVHARAERLVTELRSATFIVCGAGAAHGIVQAVVGLRTRGFGVIVARDAVLDFDDEKSKMAVLRMEAKGAIFAPTSEIIAPTPKRRGLAAFRTPAAEKAKARK